MPRLLTLFILILPLLCSAQHSNRWKNIDIKDGLSNLSINDLAQDEKDYIWLATNEGFNRYDGEFVLKFPIIDPLHISESSITDIEVDGSIIWLAIKGRGLYSYNIDTDVSEEIADLPQIDIYKLRLVEDELWITTPRQGLIRYNKITKKIIFQFDKKNNIIEAIPYGEDSMICSLVGGGLYHMSVLNDTMDAFGSIYKPLKRNIAKESTFYTCHDLHILDDKLWASCWDNALHQLVGNQFESVLFPDEKGLSFQGEEVNVFAQYKDQFIVGLKSGKLYWFDPVVHQFIPISKQGFEGGEMKSILVDKEDRIWIGTEQGLNFMETTKPLFEILNLPNVSNQTSKVQAIEQSENAIFLGTNHGLYIMDSDSIFKVESRMLDTRIYSLLHNGNKLYVGTATTVCEYDLRTLKVRDLFQSSLVIPIEHDFLPSALKYSRYTSLAIQETEYGNLLLASAFGYTMVFYHLEEDWHSFSLLDGEIKESLYNDIFVDNENNLFLAGEQDGLFENVSMYFPICEDEYLFNTLSLKEKCAIEFASLKGKRVFNSTTNPSITSNSFKEIQIDSSGTIWAGTPNGLYELGDHINKKSLLYNEIESFVIKDNSIWSISNSGLQYLDNSNIQKFYNQEDGLPESGLSGPILIDDTVLIVGGNGFIAKSNIEDFKSNNQKLQPVYLSHIQTLKDQRNPKFSDNTYTIHESDNGLSIFFTVVDYKSAADNTFSYTIPELYDFWIDNDENNEIILPALKGGSYELIVKAKDQSGQQISKPKSYFIKVNKAWYKQSWFKCLIGLILIGIGWLWYYNRQQERKKVLQMRDHISRDLHDDVGSLLGSISIYTAAANNALDSGKPEVTRSILNTIGDHSRKMIDNMSDIVWSINTDYDTFEDLMVKMEIFARKVFQAAGIATHFNMSPDLGSNELSMKKRKNIYLIFKEVIHNILKHSKANSVWISIYEKEAKINISIKDNGIGFDLNNPGNQTGNGIKSIKARADDINATLKIKSTKEEGSEVKLIL